MMMSPRTRLSSIRLRHQVKEKSSRRAGLFHLTQTSGQQHVSEWTLKRNNSYNNNNNSSQIEWEMMFQSGCRLLLLLSIWVVIVERSRQVVGLKKMKKRRRIKLIARMQKQALQLHYRAQAYKLLCCTFVLPLVHYCAHSPTSTTIGNFCLHWNRAAWFFFHYHHHHHHGLWCFLLKSQTDWQARLVRVVVLKTCILFEQRFFSSIGIQTCVQPHLLLNQVAANWKQVNPNTHTHTDEAGG